MIELSKMNGTLVLVNPDLIRYIEETPDTVLTFVDSERIMVRNPAREIVEKIVKFRALCGSPIMASHLGAPTLAIKE